MADSKLAKYVRTGHKQSVEKHPEVADTRMALRSDDNFGNLHFSMNWSGVCAPYEMVTEPHAHDFDQYLIFIGGDITNMADLGGEVELALSEDGVNLEKFVITEATTVYIPKGLYHGPLNFKKINDPTKPILFNSVYFAAEYARKS